MYKSTLSWISFPTYLSIVFEGKTTVRGHRGNKVINTDLYSAESHTVVLSSKVRPGVFLFNTPHWRCILQKGTRTHPQQCPRAYKRWEKNHLDWLWSANCLFWVQCILNGVSYSEADRPTEFPNNCSQLRPNNASPLVQINTLLKSTLNVP